MSDVLKPFSRTGRTTRAIHYSAMCAIEGQKVAFHCPSKDTVHMSVKLLIDLLDASIVRHATKRLDGGFLHDAIEVTTIDDNARPRGSVTFLRYRHGSRWADGDFQETSDFKNVYDPSCFELDPAMKKVLRAYHAFDDQGEATSSRNLRNAMSAQKGMRATSNIRDDGEYWDRRVVRMLPAKKGVADYGHHFSIPFNAIPVDARAPAEHRPDWQTCLDISNEPKVHEALQNFSEDHTEDNAVCMIREIVSAIRNRILKVLP